MTHAKKAMDKDMYIYLRNESRLEMNTNMLAEIVTSTKRLVAALKRAHVGYIRKRVRIIAPKTFILQKILTFVIGVDTAHMTLQVLSSDEAFAAAWHDTNE
jgi:hypothetical protein